MAKELPIKNIISFSGGKDSTALLLWARENLDDYDVVWMDTGWEHDITYSYIDYIDRELLGGNLIRLKSDKYDGFEDLAIKRKRVPSTKARYCTQELKLFPVNKFYDTLRHEYEIHSYVGIRASESFSRSKMKEVNFDLDYFGVWIHRPLLKWSADDVFAIMKKYDVEPNPLYKMGMKRVGCMPCIMSNQKDIREIAKRFPDVIDRIRNLEDKIGRSFFPAGYIPEKYCSKYQLVDKEVKKKIDDPIFGEREVIVKKQYTAWYPTIDDVVKYVEENEEQVSMLDEEPKSCMSHYNICE